MNRWSLPACLLCLVAVETCLAQVIERAPRKYALLVGVNQYGQPLSNLKYAVNDAAQLGRVLTESGYEVMLLTDATGKKNADRAPTRNNIRFQLDRLTAKLERNDLLIVSLSGHGMQSARTKESYFFPADGQADEPASLVAMSDVVACLGKSRGFKFLLVDACREGAGPGRAAGLSDAPALPEGVAVLFSCSRGQLSHESPAHGHGFFIYHVLQGLEGSAQNGDGEVSWDHLSAYVRARVNDSARREGGPNIRQDPNAVGNLVGQAPILTSRVRREIAEAIAAYERHDSKLGIGPGTKSFLTQYAPFGSKLWLAEARKGVPAAQILYGACLKNGIGAEKDLQGAIEWLDKAATQGSLRAQTMLGLMHYYNEVPPGMSDQQRYDAAMRYFQAAAKLGGLGAQNNIGLMYQYGRGVPRDLAEAGRWFRKAALQGMAVAQVNLGYVLEATNVEEAGQWHTRAANQGNARGQYRLSLLLEKHGRTPSHKEQGRILLRQAADQGLVEAQHHLGLRLEQEATPASLKEALFWYHKAADQGLAISHTNIGLAHIYGRGTAKNLSEGVQWLERAAQLKDRYALFQLARCYASGVGKDKDMTQAAQLYQQAAELGLALAMTNYGVCLEKGTGVPRDLFKAFDWYEKAAAKGEKQGTINLGHMYYNNRGLRKSLTENERMQAAFPLYQEAARQGHPDGQRWVGWMHQQGKGTPRDLARAREEYERAASQGNELARKLLRELPQE